MGNEAKRRPQESVCWYHKTRLKECGLSMKCWKTATKQARIFGVDVLVSEGLVEDSVLLTIETRTPLLSFVIKANNDLETWHTDMVRSG